MPWTGVVLEPLDTLFFRGGRPFGAGLRGESGLPTPQVFAGFVRTLLLGRAGADVRAMRDQPGVLEAFRAAGAEWIGRVKCRGPWLAEWDRTGVRPLVPAPADIRLGRDGPIFRLQPLRKTAPGWDPPEAGMLPLWLGSRIATKQMPEWLSFEGLRRYLHGQPLDNELFRASSDLFAWEERTGIQIEAVSQSAEEGLIYSTRNLRLRPGIAFYGEVDVPAEWRAALHGCASWGGERRQVALARVEPMAWPEASGPRLLALLAVPGFFAHGWRPAAIPAGAIRGAAVKGPFAVSGWDLIRGGPKPARFGVDAGSVYFVEGPGPPAESLAESEEDRALGYGFWLKGAWDYAE